MLAFSTAYVKPTWGFRLLSEIRLMAHQLTAPQLVPTHLYDVEHREIIIIYRHRTSSPRFVDVGET